MVHERRVSVFIVILCCHCNSREGNRARNLCWKCSRDAAIRAQYPIPSRFANRGPGVNANPQPKLPSPTDTVPGSDARYSVMQERLDSGLSITSPHDADMEGQVGEPRKERDPIYFPYQRQALLESALAFWDTFLGECARYDIRPFGAHPSPPLHLKRLWEKTSGTEEDEEE